MERMTRTQFEEFVRDQMTAITDIANPIEVATVVESIGSRFEDADSGAYYEGSDAGFMQGIEQSSGGY